MCSSDLCDCRAADRASDRLGRGGIEVVHDDGRAVGRETSGERRPESGAGTGDEGHLTGEGGVLGHASIVRIGSRRPCTLRPMPDDDELLSSRKYLTAPNLFTLVRLCCIPVFLYLLFPRDNVPGAALLLGCLGAKIGRAHV